jgi:hypothetical protein
MADLLLDYTVLDSVYNNGKFRFIQGNNAVLTINDPRDTGLAVIDPTTDEDPVLFSYLNGSPRALLVNITTDFSTKPATSIGKYTICVPDMAATPITWSVLRQNIALQDSAGNDVAGNPHGVVKIGNFLYVVEYDSAKIYRLKISNFETESGPTYVVPYSVDATPSLPVPTPPDVLYHHGAALITLTNTAVRPAVTYLYALFTSATIDGGGYPLSYYPSTVVRYTVDASTGDLSNPVAVSAGQNATAMLPVTYGTMRSILVPAIGGKQNYGSTNGAASNLTEVSNIFGSALASRIHITGDNSTDLEEDGNYDIIGFAVSANENNAYILLVTYDEDYQAYWRLYQGTLGDIMAGGGRPISDVPGLTSVDNDFGASGNLWEVLFDNTVTNGRLWFLKGTPIRVNAGNDYGTMLLDVEKPFDNTSTVGNVNSVDLIGEMLYQAAQGVGLNTRLGTTRQLAKAVRAAKAAAEEEERK